MLFTEKSGNVLGSSGKPQFFKGFPGQSSGQGGDLSLTLMMIRMRHTSFFLKAGQTFLRDSYTITHHQLKFNAIIKLN